MRGIKLTQRLKVPNTHEIGEKIPVNLSIERLFMRILQKFSFGKRLAQMADNENKSRSEMNIRHGG